MFQKYKEQYYFFPTEKGPFLSAILIYKSNKNQITTKILFKLHDLLHKAYKKLTLSKEPMMFDIEKLCKKYGINTENRENFTVYDIAIKDKKEFVEYFKNVYLYIGYLLSQEKDIKEGIVKKNANIIYHPLLKTKQKIIIRISKLKKMLFFH